MSFHKIKSWNNRVSGRLLANGRIWTRRIEWLEDQVIKLKLEDNGVYKEVIIPDKVSAQTIWNRFKLGQSIDDSISILGTEPPKYLRSRKAQP